MTDLMDTPEELNAIDFFDPASNSFWDLAGSYDDYAPGSNTFAGQLITPESALSLTAVWACRRVLAETIASLPLNIYRRDARDPRRKALASDHYLYPLLHYQPNAEMDSAQFAEVVVDCLSGWGNSHCVINRDFLGRATALWPMHPTQVVQKRDASGRIAYRVASPGASVEYPADEIWHPMIMPQITNFGLMGRSPITACRQALGLARGAEEFGARLFSNDSRTTGTLEYPGKLGTNLEESKKYKQAMRDEWQAAHSGVNRHKVAIIDQDGKFKSNSIPPDDAQFLETRKFQVAEIARIYRIPLHLIGDLERSTNNNIEHQSIEFVVYSILPWLVKLEASLNRVLLEPEERATTYIQYDIGALLRGDLKSRYEAYAIGRQWGWLSANDVRGTENMNPIEQGGDVYLEPLNMVPAGTPMSERKGGADAPAGPVKARAAAHVDDESTAADGALASAGRFVATMGDLIERERGNGHHEHFW